MAAGLPIVATDVGAVSALLDHGRLGRLVPSGAPAELVAALIALDDDPAARRDLAEAGLAFAAAHTMEAQAARLVAWLQSTFPGLPWSVSHPAGIAG
jgi:glycosyltransferase involved in cell wall biosynthesis